MDTFEYVMFGRIFKYEDSPSGTSNQVCKYAEEFCSQDWAGWRATIESLLQGT